MLCSCFCDPLTLFFNTQKNKRISKSNVKLVCHATTTTTYVSNVLLQDLSIPLACTKLQVICSELVVRNWHYYWFPIERRRAASLKLVQHTFLRMFYMKFLLGDFRDAKNIWKKKISRKRLKIVDDVTCRYKSWMFVWLLMMSWFSHNIYLPARWDFFMRILISQFRVMSNLMPR